MRTRNPLLSLVMTAASLTRFHSYSMSIVCEVPRVPQGAKLAKVSTP